MKIISLRLTVCALGLLVAGGALITYVQAATYVHTFYNTTNLAYVNSVDTHTMDPQCDESSPGTYTWSLTVNGTSISGTHTCVPPIPLPVVTFDATPSTIEPGGSSTLIWTVTGADTCTASGGWIGNKDNSGDSELVSPSVTTTYNLSCTGPGGTTNADPVTVMSPSGFISAGTCTIVPAGSVEGTSCNVNVNWNAYDFAGNPSVEQGGTAFSSSLSGPATRSVDPDNRSFLLRDTGGSFTSPATADVNCETGTA